VNSQTSSPEIYFVCGQVKDCFTVDDGVVKAMPTLFLNDGETYTMYQAVDGKMATVSKHNGVVDAVTIYLPSNQASIDQAYSEGRADGQNQGVITCVCSGLMIVFTCMVIFTILGLRIIKKVQP
jgi:hypothetical protein